MEVVIMYDQEKKKSRGEWWRMYYFTVSWNGNVAVSVICKWLMLDVVQLVELLIRKVGSFPGRGIDRIMSPGTE